MSSKGNLTLQNRQRTRPLDLRLHRRIIRALLEELLERPDYDLGFYFVAAPEMTQLNEDFLQHHGSTDVITFDYSGDGGASPPHGEIFICVDEAIRQARRFRTAWQAEIVRYLVHSVLHLLGHNDQRKSDRQLMKRQENRLLKALQNRFALK